MVVTVMSSLALGSLDRVHGFEPPELHQFVIACRFNSCTVQLYTCSCSRLLDEVYFCSTNVVVEVGFINTVFTLLSPWPVPSAPRQP